MSIRANLIFPFKRIQTAHTSIAFFCLAAMLFCAEVRAQPIGQVDTAGSTWCEMQWECSNAGPMLAIDTLSGNVYFVWTYAPDWPWQDHRETYFNCYNPSSGWVYGHSGLDMFPGEWRHQNHSVMVGGNSGTWLDIQIILGSLEPAERTMRVWWDGRQFQSGELVLDSFPSVDEYVPNCAYSRNGAIQILAGGYDFMLYYGRVNCRRPEPNEFSGWEMVDTVAGGNYVVAASPVSDRVVISYLRQRDFSEEGHPWYDKDVYLVLSSDGLEWNWAGSTNITDFGEADPLRPVEDNDAAIDYSDNTHIVFTVMGAKINRGFPESTLVDPFMSFIFHWSSATDSFSLAADGLIADVTGHICIFPSCALAVGKPQLAVNPANGYLYMLYERNRFEDCSFWCFANTDLWVSVSTDNGLNWSVGTNITDTQTPGCNGDCASEIEASLYEVVNDTLHLAYILDTEAGYSQFPYNGGITESKVIYQRVPANLISTTPLLRQFSIREGPPRCRYIPGDINGDSLKNGVDVTYAVRFLKGYGAPPVDSCSCSGMPTPFYAAGDVNGNCQFNGVDISYYVAYLKGQGPLLCYCQNCVPCRLE